MDEREIKKALEERENSYKHLWHKGELKRIDKGYADLTVTTSYAEKIEVGKGTLVGYQCVLIGPVTIGENTMLGYRTMLIGRNHGFKPDSPFCIQDMEDERIVVGDDVWIGANVIVTAGVTIGSHAVIGAGSIVTHNIGMWEIWAGNPAKKLGDRKGWFERKIPTP